MLSVKAFRPAPTAFISPPNPLTVGMRCVRPDMWNASVAASRALDTPPNDEPIVVPPKIFLIPPNKALDASGAKKANCWKEKARPAAAFRTLVMLVISRPANEVVTPATTTESAPSFSISVEVGSLVVVGLPGGGTTGVLPPPLAR